MASVDPDTGAILENEEVRSRGLAELRSAVAADKSFPPLVRTDDMFLLAFLRARKYETTRALACLRSFCTFWHGNPSLINGLCASEVRRVYEMGFMRTLSGKDIHNNNLSILDIAKVDYSKFTDFEMIRLSLYCSLVTLFDDEDAQRHGLTIVENFAGFSLWKMAMVSKKMREPGQEKVMKFGMDTIPMRIRALYVYKQPMWFSVFWAGIKYFFKKKLRDRLVLIGSDLATLHTVVPPSVLPAPFGTLEETPTAWLDKMEEQEKSVGVLGGFAFPLRVEDPTGEKRRAGLQLPELSAGGATETGEPRFVISDEPPTPTGKTNGEEEREVPAAI